MGSPFFGQAQLQHRDEPLVWVVEADPAQGDRLAAPVQRVFGWTLSASAVRVTSPNPS